MKIVMDGQPLLNLNKTGIAYYEDGLLKNLLSEYKEDEYGVDIFTFKHREEKRGYLSCYDQRLQISECSWFSGTLFRMISMFFPIPYRLFFGDKRTITHFCNYSVPFAVRGKKVVTVHDLTFREYPETVRKRTLLMLQRNLKKSIRRADAIVADSVFTKNEILKYYSVDENKIDVVPCGVNRNDFFPDKDKHRREEMVTKYHIPGDYFLYLGTLEPRKNIVGLMKAYQIFLEKKKAEGVTDIPFLVIAGGKGWMYEEIFEKVKEFGLEEKVIFTGYVDEEDKNCLLSNALVFCFPSLYEGFGMPPIEAMACGTPVLTSSTSSLDEVAGDAAYKVNPNSVDEIAEGLSELMEHKELRDKLVKKGFEQADRFTWENAVQKLHDVYVKVNGDN